MFNFIPGQRCISDTELQMGLGCVLQVEPRTVIVHFPACSKTRTYARKNAPLTRVEFGIGAQIATRDGQSICIRQVRQEEGLLVYLGESDQGHLITIKEAQLDDQMQLNRPLDRLLHTQIDDNKWFELRLLIRQRTLRHINSDTYGLSGCRTSLLPHQLYIAYEVSQRYAPRVLLADEIGLGKTIEAGLILHRQLLTERAKRVLIIVPENLIHQWLIEMTRRFNLNFSLFDEERCQAIEGTDCTDNPFYSEQLVLCSLEFLVAHPQRLTQGAKGQWDILVVDEAHHLVWSKEQASQEYNAVEKLAAGASGLLLLTATPEQLGQEGHFARLRLLDPDRFPTLDAFLAEQKEYGPVAQVAAALLGNQPLSAADQQIIQQTINEGDNRQWLETIQKNGVGSEQNRQARQALFSHLLDRHGTGRVLFRNTRDTVQGFPQRTVEFYPLDLPQAYQILLATPAKPNIEPQMLLSPEMHYRQQGGHDWPRHDPRVAWLMTQLQQWKPDKVLLITASTQSALQLAAAFSKQGKHIALFHEGMSVVERDRAAAFFADQEEGCQLLVCSEIGSEGRNFQFAHRLVLFDLPFNPDLLEQRIGRIDRIGQTATIRLYIPYIKGTAQEPMVRWYHTGLAALEGICPAGSGVFSQVREELAVAIQAPQKSINKLLEKTIKLRQHLKKELQQGRDRLLEFNSCRPDLAHQLAERAEHEDQKSDREQCMERVFDCFGVESEPYRNACLWIKPANCIIQTYPGLPEDGLPITYSREAALANEDVQYLSWEHPLMTTAMDLVLNGEWGNTAITAVKYALLPAGNLLLECLYLLEITPIEALQTTRFLPPAMIRLVIDDTGKDHSAELPEKVFTTTQVRVDPSITEQLIELKSEELKSMVQQAEQTAQQQVPNLLAAAHQNAKNTLVGEIDRLNALAKINRTIRKEEIHYFRQHLAALGQAIDSASIRLDGVRIIVVY